MKTNIHCLSVANNKLFAVNLTGAQYSGSTAPIYYTENLTNWTNSSSLSTFRSTNPRVTVTFDIALQKYMINAYTWCSTTNLTSWSGIGENRPLHCHDGGYWVALNTGTLNGTNNVGGVSWSGDSSSFTNFGSLTASGYIQTVNLYMYKGLMLVLGHMNNYSTYPAIAAYKNPVNYSTSAIFSANISSTLGAIGAVVNALFFKDQFILSTNGGNVFTFNWATKSFGSVTNVGSGEVSLACSDNLIVACTAGGTCYYSEDGISWNQLEVPNYSYQRIAYYLDTFVLLNSDQANNKLVLVR